MTANFSLSTATHREGRPPVVLHAAEHDDAGGASRDSKMGRVMMAGAGSDQRSKLESPRLTQVQSPSLESIPP